MIISRAKHFSIIIFRLRDREISTTTGKVYVYIAEGTGVSITICSRFLLSKKMPNSNIRQTIPEIAKKTVW